MDDVIAACQRFQTALGSQTRQSWFNAELTMPQARALHTIHRLGRANGRELAGELRVSAAAVVALCDRLEAHGYVERVADRADRRVTWFQLTAAGADLIGSSGSAAWARLATALARLSGDERQTLTRLLGELADALGGPAS